MKWSICCALFLCACGKPRALDVALVQDPNLNTVAQLVGQVSTVLLVIDSDDGLYLPGAEQSEGAMQIKQADSDDALELLVTASVTDGRLPRIRVEQGGLPEVPLDLRALGSSDSGPVAEGRAAGVRFGDGVSVITVPFNIRPERLPPRVMDVLPRDGESVIGCSLAAISVVFSKPMHPESLAAPASVVLEPGGAPGRITFDASGLVAQIEPPTPLVGDGTGLHYRLTVAPLVTDAAGAPLDQVPSEEGEQPFVRDFSFPCVGVEIPDALCGSPEPPPYYCPSAFLDCVDGVCVPTGCDGSTCTAGFVCDPAVARCEVDCRLYGGVCPPERPSCDGLTGLCG